MHELNKKIFHNMNFAIFEPHRDFATNPTLVALTAKSIEYGAKVDLFSPDFHDYPGWEVDIKKFPFPYTANFWCYGIAGILRNLRRYFLNSAWRAHTVLREKSYDLILGVDSDGVVAAWNYSKKNNTPYIYLSFEMLFMDELKKYWEPFHKKDEISASRQADLVVIQDKWRAKLLGQENSIHHNKFVYIPVSPTNTKTSNSSYLRNRFNIPEDNFIILHSGSFDNWTCAEELIASLDSWPVNATLVIHTRENHKNRNPYLNQLKKSPKKNLFLSTTPLGTGEYEEMVSSADIGLVLYKPIPNNRFLQKNIEVIGLSSGKFSTYLKHGLPVISTKQESYADLLKEFKFGVNVNSFTEISLAICEITANYNAYRSDALRLFAEKLDFNIYWQNFLKNLTRVLALKN